MKGSKQHLVKSGILALAAAVGFNAINALTPFNFLNSKNYSFLPSNLALAQNIDEETNIRVYEQVSPAVVAINSGSSKGSGSIITSDGLILTNAHVIGGARTVSVTLADGRRFAAHVVGFGDKGLDLAALKISGVRDLPTVNLAVPNSVRVGQRAFAIGNPFGLEGTFTVGIVSRIDRNRELIQTDAAINPGNSGGPLLNSQGQVIGVNTAIASDGRNGGGNVGIGFAIPVERIEPFLSAIREGRTTPQAQEPRDSLSGGKPPRQLPLDGSVVNGRLERGDLVWLGDNSFYDVYRFEGKAGTRIRVEMVSGDVDSYLFLVGPNGHDVAQDDDSAGGKNARIIATLPADGTYLLMANTYGGAEMGNYRLRATAISSGNQGSVVNSGGWLLRQQGILAPGAQTLPSDGSLYQTYTFEGQAGQSVTLSLKSPDFDTYLMLLDSSYTKIAESDNLSNTNTNSQMSVTLPRRGTYRVIVNARDSSGRGRYLLEVR